jgi:hypothetical protein
MQDGEEPKKMIISSFAAVTMLSTGFSTTFAATTTSSSSNSGIDIKTVIQEVTPFVTTKSNGTVSVSKKGLASLHLPQVDENYINQSIASYNGEVLDGSLDTKTHLSKSAEAQISQYGSVSSVNSLGVSSNASSDGTCGLPYSWFHSNTPLRATFQYWWGDQDVYNEKGTKLVETALGALAAGSTTDAAASLLVPLLGEASATILEGIAFGAGITALTLAYDDNGAGVNIQYAGSTVPFWVAGNVD